MERGWYVLGAIGRTGEGVFVTGGVKTGGGGFWHRKPSSDGVVALEGVASVYHGCFSVWETWGNEKPR